MKRWALLLCCGVVWCQDFEHRRTMVEKLVYANADSANVISRELHDRAFKSRNPSWVARAQSTRALTEIYLVNLDHAEQLNKQSFAYHLKNDDHGELARNHFNRALIAERRSDYVRAISNFLKTVEFAQDAHNYLLLQKAYRGLSMSSLDQYDPDKAFGYIRKALAVEARHPDPIQKAYELAALGEIYRLTDQKQSADRYFGLAYHQFESAGSRQGMAWVLTNWAILFELDFVRYTNMSLRAQAIWDDVAPDNMMSIVNLGNLGYNYMMLAQNDSLVRALRNQPGMPQTSKQAFAQAHAFYERSAAYARRKHNRKSVFHTGINISTLYYAEGNYKNAYDQLKASYRLGDSLYSQDNKNQIAAAESEKKILLRDQRIKADRLAIANKERQKWYLLIGLAMVALIAALLYRQSRNRRSTNRKLEALNLALDQKNSSLDRANKTNARFGSHRSFGRDRPQLPQDHHAQPHGQRIQGIGRPATAAHRVAGGRTF